MTMSLSAAEVERFRSGVSSRLGLAFGGANAGTLEAAMRQRLSMTGYRIAAYLERLDSSDAWPAETVALAEALTIGETYFLRNVEQFRALQHAVLPERAALRGAGQPVRILSAGCASGEEAYTLAIVARETPALAGRPVKIQGTDVNRAALRRAAAARYSAWALRETPADLRARYFRAEGREFVLADDLRVAVTFEEQNLAFPEFREPASLDVIFCRNVLMYLTPGVARAAVAHFARWLQPGGYLFLGHAETLRGLSDVFDLQHQHGTFYYRRNLTSGAALRPSSSEQMEEGSPRPDLSADTSPSASDWAEHIQRASERIRALTAQAVAPPSPGVSPAATDLGDMFDLVGSERLADAWSALARLPPEVADSPRASLARAVLLTHRQDLSAAEQLCDALLECDPRNAGAHYVRALCQERAGNARAAADADRAAVALDATFAMPRLHLGLLARRSGDVQVARRELTEALFLLQHEERARLMLFGGGFGRQALLAFCRAELAACGGSG